MRKRPLQLFSSAAASAGLVIFQAGAASANHGDTNLLNSDNREHWFEIFDLTDGGYLAAVNGRWQIEQSVMTTKEGDGDLEIFDDDLGAGELQGLAECTDLNWTGQRCDDWRITFNHWNLDTTPDTQAEENAWKHLGCHEVGHTGGINHRFAADDFNEPFSCLREDIIPVQLDPHDISEIDEDH